MHSSRKPKQRPSILCSQNFFFYQTRLGNQSGEPSVYNKPVYKVMKKEGILVSRLPLETLKESSTAHDSKPTLRVPISSHHAENPALTLIFLPKRSTMRSRFPAVYSSFSENL